MAEYAVQQTAADEARLVERARRKDRAAIRLIIKQQNRRLYRIARSIVRDDSEAEDVLQEAYLRAFCNLDPFVARLDLAPGLPVSLSTRRSVVCVAAGRPWISTF